MSKETGSSLLPRAELRLASDARSAGAARRFVRQLLHEAGRERWSDAAELAVSEVVTNGVLHAHTDLTLRVRVLPDLVEVEVVDGSPGLPTQRRKPDAEATTGRGLELVAAMTQECGVRPECDGKAVWFTVGDDAAQEPTEDELLEAWDLEGAWEDEESAAPLPETQEVLLRAMPTRLWMAAREHHREVLRELVLYVAAHGEAMPTRPDLGLVDEARQLLWNALLGEIDRLTAHREAGPAPEPPGAVDLRLSLTSDMAAAFAEMQDALDIGEQLAVANLLLVRPGLPEIVAVRDWACEQVVAQLAGVPAAPWPGTAQQRFTDLVHDRADAVSPVWDSSLVTASARGVVAADDANRIIAISDPLARTVGWRPEELVGRRVVALVPPELREAHVAGFSRHLTTGHAKVLGVDLVLPVLHRNGSTVSCSFRVERAEGTLGRPVYLAWIEPVEARTDGSRAAG